MEQNDLYSSKRAFPLDSRIVWVEQQISKSCIFPRDNLYLGPGEYDPHLPESHISSPIIKPFAYSEQFHPYRESNTAGTNRKPRGKQKKEYKLDTDLGGLSCSRSEFASLFHDHDQRMAIDPSRRYYITQTPFLPQDQFLAPILHDGKKKPGHGSVISKQEYQRPPQKVALPDYDPQYDSKQLGHIPKYGSIAKTERPELFGEVIDYSIPEEEAICTRTKTPSNKNSFTPIRKTSPIKLKSRPKLNLNFDTSCYDANKKMLPPTLSPSYINKQANVKVFNNTLLKPQSYQSQHIDSSIGTRIKRNSLM